MKKSEKILRDIEAERAKIESRNIVLEEKKLHLTFFHIFMLFRVLISPIIFLHPLWGVLVLAFLDVADAFTYRYMMDEPYILMFSVKGTKAYYHKYDKIADIFNEIAMVLYAGLIWQDFLLIILFVWRMIGLTIWYFKPKDWLMLIFPNVFFNLFLVRAFFETMIPAYLFIFETYFILFFVAVLMVTVIHEYLIHVLKYKKGITWHEGIRIIKKYIVFILFGISAIYVAAIPPPVLLAFPQWVLMPIFYVIFFIIFLVYHFVYPNIFKEWNRRIHPKSEGQENKIFIKIIVINIFTIRLILPFIFPFSLIFFYLIVQETLDWIDSYFIFNLRGEKTWRTFDDLVDWVSRLFFFLPLLYLDFLLFVFIYFFVIIGLTFVSYEFRWFKVFGINPLYVMGFYFFLPNFFYPACAVSFAIYFMLFYKSRLEIEEETGLGE